jgi:hypothetical protein
VNLHSKHGSWVPAVRLWKRLGVEVTPAYLERSWQRIERWKNKRGLGGASPQGRKETPQCNSQKAPEFSLTSYDESAQHQPETPALPEKEKKMKRNEAFPSKFLKAADINEDVTATISSVEWEEVGQDKTTKSVLYFRGKLKPLILNGTNWDKIVEVTGEDDSDEWEGKKITLFKTEVPFGREMVEAIRVRGSSKSGIKGKPTSKPSDTSDDVPF